MKSAPKIIEIPAKTYLLGEYVTLIGGPALIMSHGPKFKCSYPGQTPILQVFHPESSAGKFISKHNLQNIHIDWHDPYHGTGGMGGSGAEFITSYLLAHNLALHDADPWKIRREYLDLIQDSNIKTLPSGYDILAQCLSGINYISANTKSIKNLVWPFPDHTISLFKTNIKTKTHEHLANHVLPNITTINKLEKVVEQGLTALESKDLSKFCDAINQYNQILQHNNFVHPETTKIIQKIQTMPNILATKGCGALCSDVIIILHQIDQCPKGSIQNLIGINTNFVTV